VSQATNGALTTLDDEASVIGAMIRPEASVSSAIQLAAALIDKRIATARQWPRSVARFKKEIGDLLREDLETARSAEYAKPVGGGVVKGPSVRLAELALLCWGNAEIGMEEAVVGDKSVSVKCSAWDLERNIRQECVVSASIIGRSGRYPGHMIETTCAATASKARRNAICCIIPKAYINDALQIAKQVAAGKEKPLEERRQDSLDFFARTYKVQPEQVFAMLEVAGVDDITGDHLDDLRAIATALKEGTATVAEFFPEKTGTKIDDLKEKLKARQTSTKPEAKSEPKPDTADTLAPALAAFKEAGGEIDEFAEINKTTVAKIKAAAGKERELYAGLLTQEVELLKRAAEQEKPAEVLFDNKKSGASK
jgi:hypothetical protein